MATTAALPCVPPRLPPRNLKRVGVGSVVGDELFEAVVFLGTAVSVPVLQGTESGQGARGQTGEFALVLPFPSPKR